MYARAIMVVFVSLLALAGGILPPVSAAAAGGMADTALVVWDNRVYAVPFAGGEPYDIGRAVNGIEALVAAPALDVYGLDASPLSESPAGGYGFHHGVWSPDRARFAYLALAPDGPGYRLAMLAGGGEQTLLEGQLSPARGYLDPLGWAADGQRLLLVERYLLYNLTVLNVWELDSASGELLLVTFMPLNRLSGRSAVSPGGERALIGFDVPHNLAYVYDFAARQVTTAPVALDMLGLIVPPASVFETYPLNVIGALPQDAVSAFARRLESDVPRASAEPGRFLYWPLPDDVRRITCYPDSAWTISHHPATCPGLVSAHDYPGHQGTDVGGGTNGLPVGTPVYPAARGVVALTWSACASGTPSCGDSYGNHVLLEHTLVVAGQTQTWFTGYAHLSTVLVDDLAYVGELGMPLALSGETGLGGPHLHIEVRRPHALGLTRWVDPWDANGSPDASNLWVGDNETPVSAASSAPATPVRPICTVTASAGNNIRGGPGTAYDKLGETQAGELYAVLEVRVVDAEGTPGVWYRVPIHGGADEGWLWAGLASACGRGPD